MGVLQHFAQSALQCVLAWHLRIGDAAAARIVDHRNATARLRPGGMGPSHESNYQHQREQAHAGILSRYAVRSIAKPGVCSCSFLREIGGFMTFLARSVIEASARPAM